LLKPGYSERRAVRAAARCKHARGQDDQRRQGADEDGVDEYSDGVIGNL
jgi:hypothetical protein